MFNKYIPQSDRLPGQRGIGKGNTIRLPYTDPFERERYYAFTKHRAQAHYRREEYDLTHDDWCELWDRETFLQRGRGIDDLCLSRKDHTGAWCRENVHIVPRREHLKRNGEFRSQ